MKIKLTIFQVKNGENDMDFYGVNIGGIYEVIRHYKSGRVSIKTPNMLELPLFTSEFEIISED